MTTAATMTLGRLSCEMGHPLIDHDQSGGLRLSFRDGLHTATIAPDGRSTVTDTKTRETLAYHADGRLLHPERED